MMLGERSPILPIGVGIIKSFPLGLGVLTVLAKEQKNFVLLRSCEEKKSDENILFMFN